MKACSQSLWASLGRGIHSLTRTAAWALSFWFCLSLLHFFTCFISSPSPSLSPSEDREVLNYHSLLESFLEKDDGKKALLCPPQIHPSCKQPIKHTCQRTDRREEFPTWLQTLFLPVLDPRWLPTHFYQPFKKAPTAWLRGCSFGSTVGSVWFDLLFLLWVVVNV